MKDEIFDKFLSTFSKEELAGMYAVISKREVEYLKEIKGLRLSLQLHGEIVEMNYKLEEENARLRDELETTKKQLDEAVYIMRNKLTFEDQHPCMTGDCPHEKQSECDEVLDSLSIEEFLAKLSKERGE